MSDLEEQLKQAIKEKGFNAADWVEFMEMPSLALLAGARVGHAMALTGMADTMKYVNSNVETKLRRRADAKV